VQGDYKSQNLCMSLESFAAYKGKPSWYSAYFLSNNGFWFKQKGSFPPSFLTFPFKRKSQKRKGSTCYVPVMSCVRMQFHALCLSAKKGRVTFFL
jgi:hypothetical protein